MIVQYLFSSPEGDISLIPDALARPFKITPSIDHPFLTLGDYFKALEKFLLKDQSQSLVVLLEDRLDRRIHLDHIDKVFIRSEKHGALYHLGSVEILIDRQRAKYAVNTALSERGKAWLNHEYSLLGYLAETFNLPYLPRVYFKGELEHKAGTKKESLSMFLAEWFEDYHEWHLSMDEKDRAQKLRIWDQRCGHRFATEEESYEIYKQASKILTLYYNTQSFRQIYPWHHAAGDFVVRISDGKVDVRLTTARGHDPFMGFVEEEDINPLVALIYFFLNLTIKMRLDRLDGMGEAVWADGYSVRAALEGFLEALHIMEREGRYDLGKLEDLLSVLKSFTHEELHALYHPLLEAYHEEDPGDLLVIEKNLEDHTEQLFCANQRFHE
jgi:hypothetical protein